MDEDETVIVCTLLPGAVASVNQTDDLQKALFRWQRNLGSPELLPVAGLECDPEVFKRVTHTLRLPNLIPVHRAAVLFGRVGMPAAFRPAQLAQIRKLGAAAKPLLLEWRNAIAMSEAA